MREIALDTETTGLSIRHGCRPFFLVTQIGDHVRYYEWDVDPTNRTPIIPSEDIDDICNYFQDSLAIGFNTKFDLLALESIGICLWDIVGWDNIHDVMLMSHALESGGRHGLKQLCVRHLGILDDDEKRLGKAANSARAVGRRLKWDIARPKHPHFPMIKDFGEKNPAWKCDMWLPRAVCIHEDRDDSDPWWTVLQDYALTDGKRTLELYYELKRRLEEEGLYEQYEKNRKLLEVTYKMESRGISLRPHHIRRERMRFHKSIKVYGTEAKQILGKPNLNLNSDPQLRKVVYSDYEMPTVGIFTPTGMPSTSADALAKLHVQAPEELQEAIERIIIQRKFEKGLSYLENFDAFNVDGKVHCNFKITGTSVTRMSVMDPPMQTVGKTLGGKEYWPDDINDALAKAGVNLRKCFGPAPGREWFALDYQQAHPRIFAWLSGDKEAQQVFNEGRDYYIHLAKGALNKTEEEITKPQRALFKMVNLADMYGVGDEKLEKNTGMSGLKDLLAKTFPTRALFIGKIKDSAVGKGYITTVGGYRLYCPQAHKRVNYTIIGCEGEIAKQALYDCHVYLESLADGEYNPFVALQVHDELLFDFPVRADGSNRQHVERLAEIMEEAGYAHKVNIPVEISHIKEGTSWNDKIKLERLNA